MRLRRSESKARIASEEPAEPVTPMLEIIKEIILWQYEELHGIIA